MKLLLRVFFAEGADNAAYRNRVIAACSTGSPVKLRTLCLRSTNSKNSIFPPFSLSTQHPPDPLCKCGPQDGNRRDKRLQTPWTI